MNRFSGIALTLLPVVALALTGCGGGYGDGRGSVVPVLSTNARLADLSISAGDFDQIFQSSLTDYTATVSLLKSTTTVTATIEDANATVTVNGAAAVSATASGKVTLNVGNTAITITVTAADGVTTETYSIDIARQTVANFAQRAYVKASNPEGGRPAYGEGDRFGSAIALSGNTMAVSAPYEDSGATGINGDQFDNSATESGAVYIFVRDSSGVWSQQAYIKSLTTEPQDRFGGALDLDGDTLVVAHNVWDNWWSDDKRKPLLFYTRDEMGAWKQQGSISIPDFGTAYGSDLFGLSLSLNGDTLAVGAPLEDSSATGINGDETDNNALSSGAAYVYTRDTNGVWSQQAYIKASNTGGGTYDDEREGIVGGDLFGFSVALDGDTLAVGATGEDSNATGINGDQTNSGPLNSGAVYVFVRDSGGNWSQQAYVKASNPGVGDFFSNSIALSGDTLVVGAANEDSAVSGMNGDQTNNDAKNAGAVYIYVRGEDGDWSQQAYIKSSNPDLFDGFGESLALFGDSLVISTFGEDSGATGIDGDQNDNSRGDAGAAYLITRDDDGIWTQQAYIKSSNPEFGDRFGHQVALDDDIIAVGAYLEDSGSAGINGDQADNSESKSGATYVFQ